jgi:filamentous hemagglutinin family protein
MINMNSTQTPPFCPHLVARAVAAIFTAVWMCVPTMGHANVTPDGKTLTSVTTSANGSTNISIAPTKPDGSSYNSFTSFDAINAYGTYFNNISASLIIAEVFSQKASTIGGPLGIIGPKASFMLVNPNGITVNGNVVLTNIAQATFVVGATNRVGDLVTSLDTSKAAAGASLTINGALSNPSGALALLSPVIKMPSGSSVTASNSSELTVAIGNATFDPRSARLLAVDPSAPSTVSVDASLLGAMNAGVINVISTRQGAGVNIGGTLTGQQGIKVDVQGGSLDSSDAQFTAQGADGISLRVSNALTVKNGKLIGSNVVMEGGKSVDLSDGTLQATNDVTVSSGADLSMKGQTVSAGRHVKVTAVGNVDLGVTTSSSTVVDPEVANNYSSASIYTRAGIETGTVEVTTMVPVPVVYWITGPFGVQIPVPGVEMQSVTNYVPYARPVLYAGGRASMGANYSSAKTTSTTQTVTRLNAGQDLTLQAGGRATLVGSILEAGRDATVSGAKSLKLLAAQDSFERNDLKASLDGGGDVSGTLPTVFFEGNLAVNGSVSGQAVATQTSTTTAKVVTIKAGRDAQALSAQGDVVVEGATITAKSGQAKVTAAGDVIMGAAASASSSFSETAQLQGSVNVPIRVDSALDILGGLIFRGTELLSHIHVPNINIAGSGKGAVKGSSSTIQSGATITGGQAVNIDAGKKLYAHGGRFQAPTLSLTSRDGTLLSAAMSSLIKVDVKGVGALPNQNLLQGIKLDIAGDLDGSVSAQGRGTELQSDNIQVSSSNGVTELQGASLNGTRVSIEGAKGVLIGTSLDLTGQVNANLQGKFESTLEGMSLKIEKPTLFVNEGGLGFSVPSVDLKGQSLLKLAVEGTAKGQMSIGGNGSQISATQDIVISASNGDIKLTGSKLASGASTTVTAPKGAINMASSLRLSGNFDSQFNAGFKSLADVSVLSIEGLGATLNPSTLRLDGIGVAADLTLGIGGLSGNGTPPKVSANLSLSGEGSITLGSDASSIKAGQDVKLIGKDAIVLSKPDIQAGGLIGIAGKSVDIKATFANTATGALSAFVPVQLTPTLDLDFSKSRLDLGGSFALVQTGGQLTAKQGVSIQALAGGVKAAATSISTPGTVSIQATRPVQLNAGISLINGKLSFKSTKIMAGQSVAYKAPAVNTFLLAPAVVTSPLITLNGRRK